MTTGIYLLHFEPSYKHARHYLGWSPEVQARINAHVCGKGARLTEVAYSAGVNMIWVRTWLDADRKTERKFKNRSHVPMLCPICRGEAVQMPLMPWMPAYVPADVETDVIFALIPVDDSQLALNLFDIDAATEELIDAREDEEFWRRGSW